MSQSAAQNASEEALQKLKDSAATGDFASFKREFQQWEQIADLSSYEPTISERIGALRYHTSSKTLPLQRVLGVAAKEGHVEIVGFLLDQGCNITAPAVRWAMSRKRWSVLELYLERGWDINTAMEGGNTLPVLKQVYHVTARSLNHSSDWNLGRFFQVQNMSGGVLNTAQIRPLYLPAAIMTFPVLQVEQALSRRYNFLENTGSISQNAMLYHPQQEVVTLAVSMSWPISLMMWGCLSTSMSGAMTITSLTRIKRVLLELHYMLLLEPSVSIMSNFCWKGILIGISRMLGEAEQLT